ncbi:MAG: hypothetical protein WD423_10610 [Rhodothermales bacterium]
MRAIDIIRRVGPVDLRNVRRDDFLAWVIGLPFLIALLFRFGVPPLSGWLAGSFDFDLTPYYPLIMSSFVVMAPSMVGMVTGFLLLDERDDRILTALLVTPMPFGAYLSYKITAPLVVGFVVTLAGYPIAGLAPIPFGDLLVVALMGSLTGPVSALFLAVTADNKVSGFALTKVLNTINVLPIAAYFVAMPWQLFAGVVPAYWPIKLVWLSASGQPIAGIAAAGFVVNVVAIIAFLRLFNSLIRR